MTIPTNDKPFKSFVDDDKLIISPIQIYRDLVIYLEGTFPEKEIQVPTGILYTDMSNGEVLKIVNELKTIAGRYKKINDTSS